LYYTECSYYLSPASLEFAEGAEKDELTILCDICVPGYMNFLHQRFGLRALLYPFKCYRPSTRPRRFTGLPTMALN